MALSNSTDAIEAALNDAYTVHRLFEVADRDRFLAEVGPRIRAIVTGGNYGATFGTGTPLERARQFLAQVEPVMPGLSARFNDKATVDFWPGNKWSKGSYAYWKVGQYQKFAGVEQEREGRLGTCHFAGEHTSVDFQGYLQGAVETGQRAASEVVSALRR